MNDLRFVWTDGLDPVFQHFYRITEAYYSRVAGGEENRRAFIPHNLSAAVSRVLLVYADGVPAACCGLKRVSDTDAEIKRVWVEPAYRRQHIASEMMRLLETEARRQGFRRLILQTRPVMTEAVALYEKCGYRRIPNYPPYDRLEGAVCYARALD